MLQQLLWLQLHLTQQATQMHVLLILQIHSMRSLDILAAWAEHAERDDMLEVKIAAFGHVLIAIDRAVQHSS